MRESFSTSGKASDKIKRAVRKIVWPSHYHIADTHESLGKIARLIIEHKVFTFDLETTGLNAWKDRVLCCSIYVGGESFVIPFEHKLMKTISITKFSQVLKDFFVKPEYLRINHNIKFDCHFLREQAKIPITDYFCDTLTQAWVIDATSEHGLKELCIMYGIEKPEYDDDGKLVSGNYSNQFGKTAWSYLDAKLAAYYACKDAELAYKLYARQCAILETKPKLKNLFWNIEMPMSNITYGMEKQGIRVDLDYYSEVLKPTVYNEYLSCIEALRPHITPFLFTNEALETVLESPKRLYDIFFDKIGVPVEKFTTLKRHPETKEWTKRSLDSEAIKAFAKTFQQVKLLGDYRKIAIIKKMFVDKLFDRIINGRIHPRINSIGAETGRMSMAEPSLHQIPSRRGPLVRNLFLPDDKDVLVSMDFSGQEMRILAHFSQDEKLLKFFREGSKLDIYSQAVVDMEKNPDFNVKEFSQQPKDERKKNKYYIIYKSLILGLGFGMGPDKFARNANISLSRAKELYELYYLTYPGVKKYQDRAIEFARKYGYIVTLLGRERKTPYINSQDMNYRSKSERMCMNVPIQGTASDQVKKAAIAVTKCILKNNWPVRIVLIIHDEIVYSVKKTWAKKNPTLLIKIRDCQTDALKLSVPMESSIDIEDRWGTTFDMEKFEALEELEGELT